MKKQALIAAKAAYEIEYECIKNMLEYFDDEAFSQDKILSILSQIW